MRINIYMRNIVNNSSMVPVPITEFILPRASDVTLELLVVALGDDKNPFDLTGADVEFTIRKHKHYIDDDDIVVQKVTNGGIYVDQDHADLGWLDIDLTAEDLELAASRYYYDLSITNVESQTVRQAMGKFTLLP